MGLSIFAVWTSRKYLTRILKHTAVGRSGLDESNEPIRYWNAILGIILGLAYLVGFSYKMGLTIWIAVAFFLICYFLSIRITRM